MTAGQLHGEDLIAVGLGPKGLEPWPVAALCDDLIDGQLSGQHALLRLEGGDLVPDLVVQAPGLFDQIHYPVHHRRAYDGKVLHKRIAVRMEHVGDHLLVTYEDGLEQEAEGLHVLS